MLDLVWQQMYAYKDWSVIHFIPENILISFKWATSMIIP